MEGSILSVLSSLTNPTAVAISKAATAMLDPGIGHAPRVVLKTSCIGRRASCAEIQSLNNMKEGSTAVEGWEAIVMMMSKATMRGLGSTMQRGRMCRKVRGGTAATETRVSNVSEVGTALHR